MCAIAGIVNCGINDGTRQILEKMLQAQAHRGPDDSGIYEAGNAVIGHRRLAVLDLEGGHQPMTGDDGNVTVILNGEIYNYRELRTRLIQQNHHFRTDSDTEVLLHLYEHLGSECISFLDGMFAFAVYDAKQHKLLLARDRMGKKPLFYFMTGHTLVFASELGGLMEHPDMPRTLDENAVSDYVSLQYVPAPGTVFRQVRQLPPAHLLEQQFDTGTLSIRSYWHLDFSMKPSEISFRSAAAELRRRVEKAVEKRLVSDVPLGFFLSGGIDSCIVTGVAARLLSPAPCNAFTAGFAEPSYDERAEAAVSADVIRKNGGQNLCCHERVIDPCDFELLRKLVRHYGQPFADASQLPAYLLSRFARESVKVVLSGDGADELFAGYDRYRAYSMAIRLETLPTPLRRLCFGLPAALLPDGGERSFSGRLRRFLKLCSTPAGERYFGILNRCPHSWKKELFGPRLRPGSLRNTLEYFKSVSWELTSSNRIERLSELDIATYLPGDVLTKVDVASMASGLEVRSPFLDRDVVEFAARLPQNFKRNARGGKYILKAAFPELLPEGIRRRPKRGFGVPVASWLRGPWKERTEEALFHGKLLSDGFFREAPLRRFWNEHQSGKRDHSYLLWDLLILSLFLDENSVT